jgi:hypothetical protein
MDLTNDAIHDELGIDEDQRLIIHSNLSSVITPRPTDAFFVWHKNSCASDSIAFMYMYAFLSTEPAETRLWELCNPFLFEIVHAYRQDIISVQTIHYHWLRLVYNARTQPKLVEYGKFLSTKGVLQAVAFTDRNQHLHGLVLGMTFACKGCVIEYTKHRKLFYFPIEKLSIMNQAGELTSIQEIINRIISVKQVDRKCSSCKVCTVHTCSWSFPILPTILRISAIDLMPAKELVTDEMWLNFKRASIDSTIRILDCQYELIAVTYGNGSHYIAMAGVTFNEQRKEYRALKYDGMENSGNIVNLNYGNKNQLTYAGLRTRAGYIADVIFYKKKND